jgi:NCS2 family nucleobase:cation symporter-2
VGVHHPIPGSGGAPADPIDEVGAPSRLLLFGLQHVLVMYAGTVAVPLILGSALGFTPKQVIALISADLFTSGLATLLQTIGWWKFGARLPLIQGCSFICVAPMILIGSHYGIPALYGSVISCGLFTMLVGPWFSRMLRFFPPVVIGSVITVIGLSLLPVAGGWLGGGDPTAAGFGSFGHLGLGLATIVLIVGIQRFGRGMIANLSVLLGLIGGTALAALAGEASFGQVAATPWFAMAHPLLFGPPHFVLLPALVMSLSMLVVMTETTGNCLAIGEITGRPIGRATLTAAFRADGLSTVLGGVFNSFPYNVYSQNTGLLALSKIKSRFAVAAGGWITRPARVLTETCCRDRGDPPACVRWSIHSDVRYDDHGRHRGIDPGSLPGHQQCDHRGGLRKYGCAADCFAAAFRPCVRCGAALLK